MRTRWVDLVLSKHQTSQIRILPLKLWTHPLCFLVQPKYYAVQEDFASFGDGNRNFNLLE